MRTWRMWEYIAGIWALIALPKCCVWVDTLFIRCSLLVDPTGVEWIYPPFLWWKAWSPNAPNCTMLCERPVLGSPTILQHCLLALSPQSICISLHLFAALSMSWLNSITADLVSSCELPLGPYFAPNLPQVNYACCFTMHRPCLRLSSTLCCVSESQLVLVHIRSRNSGLSSFLHV